MRGTIAPPDKPSTNPSAIDVIRYVYLARELERQGDHEAARRWQRKADEWLHRQDATTHRPLSTDSGTEQEPIQLVTGF